MGFTMEEHTKAITEYEKYADEMGIILNPNKKFVDVIVKGLLRNENEKGHRYCPCRRPTGDHAEDKKIVCPCDYHMDEINEKGNCHCMLFMKKE